MLSFLDYLHKHRDDVVDLVGRADRRTVARGSNPAGSDVFVVGTRPERVKRALTIQGFEMEVTDTGGRYPKVRPTDVARTYRDVPYLAKYAPTRTVRLPRGYLINVPDPAVIARIRDHGIVVERLVAPATVEVEAFSVSKLTGSPFSDQGHFTSTIEGTYLTKEVAFPRGATVRMAQPSANVAALRRSSDGLVTWNFLDRYLAFQWIPQPMEFPVYKLHQSVNLVTDTIQ
jgi:hypothetical protein